MSEIRDPDATSPPATGAPQSQDLAVAESVAVLISEMERYQYENGVLKDALNDLKDELNDLKDELNDELKHLKDELKDRQREIDTILNSASWRITKPLRSVMRRLRRMLARRPRRLHGIWR